jgi:hypothetical protein
VPANHQASNSSPRQRGPRPALSLCRSYNCNQVFSSPTQHLPWIESSQTLTLSGILNCMTEHLEFSKVTHRYPDNRTAKLLRSPKHLPSWFHCGKGGLAVSLFCKGILFDFCTVQKVFTKLRRIRGAILSCRFFFLQRSLSYCSLLKHSMCSSIVFDCRIRILIIID